MDVYGLLFSYFALERSISVWFALSCRYAQGLLGCLGFGKGLFRVYLKLVYGFVWVGESENESESESESERVGLEFNETWLQHGLGMARVY